MNRKSVIAYNRWKEAKRAQMAAGASPSVLLTKPYYEKMQSTLGAVLKQVLAEEDDRRVKKSLAAMAGVDFDE